jgi:hypothetical protein
MTISAFPTPYTPFRGFANDGSPLSGGLLWSYAAGTNTPLVTYQDPGQVTPNLNPIVLNARGEAPVFLPPNVAYKFLLTDSLGNTIPGWPIDNLELTQLITLFGGIDTGSTNAYILTFTTPQSAYTNGTVIYWIPANNNSGASTMNVNALGIVSIVNPNGTPLGANQIVAGQMTQIIYYNGQFQLVSIGNFTGSTIGTFGPETAIPSASTTDLGSALAHVVLITGTTTITSFGTSASLSAPIYIVRFSGGLTLTYNPSTMLLPANSSIITTAGDAAVVEYLGSGAWKVLVYQIFSGANPNTKVKPSDTAITSNAVLTADPDLVSNSLVIGRYSFELYLVFDGPAAGGFQWTNGGTAVDSRGLMPALAYGWVNAGAYGPKSDTFYSTTITYTTIGTAADANQVLYKGTMLVGTAGTLSISWAQASSNASPTTLRAGSYLNTTLLNTGSSVSNVTRQYTTGTGTETVPSGYNTVTIEVWGGGGGGGNGRLARPSPPLYAGGGGGGAGGYCRSVVTVTGLGGDTVTYSVGAGGAIATIGTLSSVTAGTLAMTTMTASPGAGGASASGFASGAGGAGGAAVGGTVVNTTGGSGQAGYQTSDGSGTGAAGGQVTGLFGSGGGGGMGGGGSPAAGNVGLSGLIIFSYSV